MSYDPEERRDTPLALKLKERIRREGAITVAEYMQACLQDPEHGYYRRMPAIGAGGDFTTAPEISQVFGELIGLWCAVVWQQMGSPEVVHLVELGPGRGTMMRDALRAGRVLPGFMKAVRVHLVESNVFLRELQRAALAPMGIATAWHDDWLRLGATDQMSDDPVIAIGNEFLDVLPIEQSVFSDGGWHARRVVVDGRGRLAFETAPYVERWPASFLPSAPPTDGDVIEICPGHATLARALLGLRAQRSPLAALLIDYGHATTSFGDTLQAVGSHKATHPLAAPGDSDLTAQVDFEHFAKCARGIDLEAGSLAVDGPVTQSEFLGSLGIVERASRLMAANPARAGEIEAGVARLIAPNAMGSRFKAIGLRSAGLPPLPGFPVRSAI